MEELEQYKKKVKKNVEKLINSNELEEAEKVILEYEEIIKNDVEITSMKAIILIMKSELYEALDIIENGLKIDSKNFDLLYNKAYIKELQKKYKEAYRCYNKSISFINDQSIKEQIKEKLEYIKNIDNIYALNGNLSVFTVDDNLNA
ncbi:hypothetical protein LAV58_02660, partial [Clostridium botulinum]|nr:hypothetical protein [Clostridium botulinum]